MTSVTAEPGIGPQLRRWRQHRQLSQLQLSNRAGVSTRHLSWVENGRSRPTRDMIERLAGHLDVPLRERNQLLLSGGFAPAYSCSDLSSPELFAVSSALQALLEAQSPFPALLLDRWWDVVDYNAAVDPLLAGCAPHLLEPPMNAVRLALHPDGVASQIINLGQWRRHLIGQVRRRADRLADPRLAALADEVAAYPGDDVDPPDPTDVVVPMRLRVDDGELRFFSVLTSVESAHDVTIDELRVECFYPADAATRETVLNAARSSRP
ncbi:helix-turn-helix domain-containing protein [Gordonia neofelifaecis]|uniref:Helix-turn-helix domain protein n=1 Tax=Gordonia neofelifaecis NRRL B-59395 TaxID=644548 RepID=F1YNJ8_9ACTN|nr:helix-turn-helix transcriptional regulator [Gordonia neofelifaecis]EGD53735.1 helix-turn-helix domain protein [Gordonia neofelifaecis NRRL B-59395]